jgi:hypothetical protein
MFLKRVSFLCYILLFFVGLKAADKNDQQDLIRQRLNCASTFNEKVYLHLNRSIYISGESLNYKAYVINSENQLGSGSTVLYLELINSQKQRIIATRSYLQHGTTNGIFTLPDTLPTGTYFIKAFTNLMRNNSSGFYFSAPLFVANQAKEIPENNSSGNGKPAISFFPEGGTLLEGVENRVVFKLPDNQTGDFNGEIRDDSGNNVLNFKPVINNFGSFNFKPEKGRSYKAVINRNESIPLHVSKSGIVLKVVNTDKDNLLLKINSNIDLKENNAFQLFVIAGTKVISSVTVNALQSEQTILFAKSTLPDGIIHFVLFDSNLKTICDRPVCNKKELNYLMSVYPDKREYSSKQKVKVRITLLDRDYKISPSLSVSVSAQEPLVGVHQSIENYLKQASDFKENPGYFYSDSTSAEWIDMIVLSQDQDNFKWKSLFNGLDKNSYHAQEDNGFTLMGTVVNKETGKPVKNEYVLVSTPDSLANLNYACTDTLGRFGFIFNKFYDKRKLIFTLTDPLKAKESRIIPEDKFVLDSSSMMNNIQINAALKSYIASAKRISLINKIYFPSAVNNVSMQDSINNVFNFYGKPDYVEYPSDYIDLPNFEDICTNILHGVKFRLKKDKYSITIYNPQLNSYWPSECLVLLNNVPFHDLNYVATFDSKKIKRIEVSQQHVVYGNTDFYGVVSIFTKEGEILTNGTSILVNNTVETLPKFDQNQESSRAKDTEKLPDYRQTLYWNPNITLNENGSIDLEFYTSELKTRYLIDVQGITKNGNPVSAVNFFDVK